MISVYMGIPSTGDRSDAQCYLLREMEEKYKDKVKLVYPTECIHRIFHDFARNAVVEDFLKTECDILWFLDSDVVPPHNTLDLIVEHGEKWLAAGCAYPVFQTVPNEEMTQVVFTIYQANGTAMHAAKLPYSGTDFVGGLATGCMFLKREIFREMERPYFEFKYDPQSRQPIEGEDLGFCSKLAAKGIKFFTDYGMVCKHYKRIDLLEVNNYAISYANKSVTAYRRDIEGQMTGLMKEAYQMGKMSQPTQSKSQLILPNSLR